VFSSSDADWAIVRPASIASWPAVPFTNKSIKTADTLLVAGHSFTGSSDSSRSWQKHARQVSDVPPRSRGSARPRNEVNMRGRVASRSCEGW
jgi:hypothetical protein